MRRAPKRRWGMIPGVLIAVGLAAAGETTTKTAADLPPALAPLGTPLPGLHRPKESVQDGLVLPRIDTAPVVGRTEPSPQPLDEKLQAAARSDNWLLDSLEALKGDQDARTTNQAGEGIRGRRTLGPWGFETDVRFGRPTPPRGQATTLFSEALPSLRKGSGAPDKLGLGGRSSTQAFPTPAPNPYLAPETPRTVKAATQMPVARPTPAETLPTPPPAPTPIDTGLQSLPRF